MQNLCLVIESLLDVYLSDLGAGSEWPHRRGATLFLEAFKEVGVRRKIKKSLTSLRREKCRLYAVRLQSSLISAFFVFRERLCHLMLPYEQGLMGINGEERLK